MSLLNYMDGNTEREIQRTETDKVRIAVRRIKEFCPPAGYYVAFSGGKDSQVILDLVQRAGVKYDAHMNLTTVDPPEVLKFVREHYSYVALERPEKAMRTLIIDNLYPPTRIARYCCKWLKERGGEGRFVVLGVRAQESSQRSHRNMVEACNKGKGRWFLNPIIDWTEDDVWNYIKKEELPYSSLYDEGQKRIGCILCPMGNKAQRIQQAERWPAFKRIYVGAFNEVIRIRTRR